MSTAQASLPFSEPLILDVHVNLNTGGLSSKITSGKQYGRLYAHSQTALIRNAKFRVQEGGWKRAVKQKCRNVHAMVRGETTLDIDVSSFNMSDMIRIRYNPFIHGYFFRADNEDKVRQADMVILDNHAMYALNPK